LLGYYSESAALQHGSMQSQLKGGKTEGKKKRPGWSRGRGSDKAGGERDSVGWREEWEGAR